MNSKTLSGFKSGLGQDEIVLADEETYDQFVKYQSTPGPSLHESKTGLLSGISSKKSLVPKTISVSKESLYIENLEIKEKSHALEQEVKRLNTQIEYLKGKHSEYNKLIEESAKKSKTPVKKLIRINENLKSSVESTQKEIKNKDEELKNIRKDIRYSQVHELRLELESYKDECFRLKRILEEKESKDNEINTRLSLNISLFEGLQKENRVIREKLELLMSEEKEVEQKKNKRVSDKLKKAKKYKRKISKLADENLKLKSSFNEVSKELADKENDLKNEISYLRRKIEESDLEVMKLKTEVQRNSFFKVFYECRFCNLQVSRCESLLVSKKLCKGKTEEKSTYIETECERCIEKKKVKNNECQTPALPKLVDISIQYENNTPVNSNLKLKQNFEKKNLTNKKTLKLKDKKKAENDEFQNFKNIDSQIKINKEAIDSDNILDLRKCLSPLIKLEQHQSFYEKSSLDTNKRDLSDNIRTLPSSKKADPDKFKIKLNSPKKNFSSTQLNLNKKVSKLNSRTIIKYESSINLKNTNSLSELRKSTSKSSIVPVVNNINKRPNNISPFNVSREESKEIIFEDAAFRNLNEDSLHSSSNNSGIFINEDPLVSYNAGKKVWETFSRFSTPIKSSSLNVSKINLKN